MKQLHSAGALTATSANARMPGVGPLPSFKAASRGVLPEEVQAALSNTQYLPPPAWKGEPAGPLPVKLALIQTPLAGRMLTHVTPNGGTYFAHALLNIPSTADAQLAIKTWKSPHWQRHENATAGELPELPYLPVADFLDDDTLRIWLQEPARQTMVEFVISALLSTSADSRIVVGAPAEDVAQIVYAVTRALPHSLLDHFTFSTYEADPGRATTRLIGHDSGLPEADLPVECYVGNMVAFNAATGRKSELPAEVPFAAFAVQALAHGNTAPLDELQSTWQQMGLTDARQFDLVFRLANGSMQLTKQEAAAAVAQPTLAAWMASRPAVVSQFVAWALEDTNFAHQALSRLIVPLRQKVEAINRVAAEVRQAGLSAVIAGDQARAATALEVILPMAAPARANAAWGELLAQVADPSHITWEMRRYLLPRLVRYKHATAQANSVDPALEKWLHVPIEQLQDFLSHELPAAYQIAAARACLAREGEPSAIFARAVAAQTAVALQLLQSATEAPDDRAAILFEKLLTESPGHQWFDDVLANASSFSATARNRLFEVALCAGKLDPEHVIRSQGSVLLELFSGQSGLDQLGRRFLAAPPADVFSNRTILGFLSKLQNEPQVGSDVKSRIDAIQSVREFLDRPEISAETLGKLKSSLAAEPPVLPASAKGQVLDGISDELVRRSASSDFQRDLELVLAHLGSVLAESNANLYRELLRRQRARRDFGASPRVIEAFLALALGATQSEHSTMEMEGLEAEAFAIATDAARRRGRRALAEIEAHSKRWPKSARTQWGFLAKAVRPKEIGRSLRELTLFAAGAGAATLVWFVVAYFTR